MNLCWKSGKCSYDEKRRAYRHLVSLRVDYGYGGEVYRARTVAAGTSGDGREQRPGGGMSLRGLARC